ncbi:flagellar hook assembly protein FlgD [Vibrio sp. MEBiC08052]|uniref:flagellar hook assembly protein FlgD n=1 Tax=Vibrio sp. MEBiC08052 TaxID=1761910 RepID=UPI000740750D|nr:flagellar hook capping FlgD N-terminal domain-containing protein [Vibrio sp. MEBiC08052]KUI97014.1 hypothetical protein VRK_38690 [Vibrio sp. MEBiC08052]
MSIEAIGSRLATDQVNSFDNTTLSQEDFIRLFMAQLNFQDPLEPVDNAQFMAQMAQFTSVEQTRLMNEKMDSLLTLGSVEQATGLLGQHVEVTGIGGNSIGTVKAIEYTAQGARLTVDTGNEQFLKGVSIANVRVITAE